ncbi:MAG: ATP-binding protein, partial [Bacteroidota bacterium]|nr:ATP-binding protein [Bacteroidota bacterium]
LNEMADGSFISCLLEDREGTIWVATHNRGLYFFNPSTGTKGHFRNEATKENSLSNNSINSIFEDSHGNLWLTTEGGGLCQLDKRNKRFTRYSMKDGLPSNFVFKVLEDENKMLWITTSKGLASLDIVNERITVFTKSDGLLNDQFNYNSGFKNKYGNLYFGSVQGLIQFNPASARKTLFTPPVYITGLQVQNKEVERAKDSGFLKKSIVYTEQITLPYDQSSFSIDFAAVSFTSPETIEYSYIMKGLDKDWTHLKSNRKVYFTNLKPGTYTFHVRAGSNSKWNQTATTLQITITPPFWATVWAYLLYIAIAALLAFYLIRVYHQIQENRKEKEIYKAKIEFFTNIAHEIKTPLTLIKGPVENLADLVSTNPEIKEDVNTMERNTNRLLTLVNQILDFRQTETKAFSLELTEVNISEILREAYLTFEPLAKKRKLKYIMELPSYPVSTKADAEALTKVFHNLFSNAVKYAHEEVRAKLLSPRINESKLVFEISNDGYLIPEDMKERIFEPFFRIKDTSKQKGTGLGLALARSLVELHNGKIYVKETNADCNLFIIELPHASVSIKRKNRTETNNRNV